MAEKENTLQSNRIIYLNGTFCEKKAEEVIRSLIEMELKNSNKDILMIIDSYGGTVHSFLAIYDAIKILKCNVATLSLGKSMSCGALMLLSGTKGKRFSTEHSRILIHEMESVTVGQLSMISADAEEFEELNKIVIDIMVKQTKLSKKEAEEFLSQQKYMSPQEAKKYGLIDHIVFKHNDLYKKINI